MKNTVHCLKKELTIKWFITIFLLVFIIYSCHKNESNDTYIITNSDLAQRLKEFINDSELHNKQNEIITEKKIINNDIIVALDITNQKDTILTLINAKPFTCNHVKGLISLKGYNVFLYSDMNDDFLKKYFKIMRPLDSCENYIKEQKIDVTFKVNYYIKNERFVKM